MRRVHRLSVLIAAVAVIAGLAGTAHAVSIVATTTIVADVVRAVAGDDAKIVTLLPPNADPHSYEPTPRDVVSVSKADVVFISGANLEAQFANILANARGPVVDLSTRIALRYGADIEHDHDEAGSGEEDDHEEAHHHGEFDPHVWFDPTNVMIWTAAIEETLCKLDPDNSAVYASNAGAYRRALAELDLWIWEQVARLPYGHRDLVTDHLAFGYFAAR
jgi:manganese/iron transport system substrate-binding protein